MTRLSGRKINAAKYYLRYALQIPGRYRRGSQSLPHIFLFATRRGGSTLLREMLYSQAGINSIDQPFDLTDKQFNPYRKVLPDPPASQFIQLTPNELAQIDAYLTRLLSREYILRSQWNWFDNGYRWSWDRYVVKILNAKALIEHFEQQFDCQIVYALRHPVPTALSIIKRNWIYTAPAYLENEYFVERYLPKNAVDFGFQVMKNGNQIERHVLEWCLENKVPLLLHKSKPWLTVYFERLISNPTTSSHELCRFLGLNEPHKMASVTAKPSQTAWDSKSAISKFGAKSRLDAWKERIDTKTLRNCAEILDRYEIDTYGMHSAMPRE